jgi:1-deoxy-D-xylulose-5-phosphate reductoisomerase
MAFAALADGGMQPAVLNGANEIAVEAFLDGRIGYTDITAVVAETLAAGIEGDDMDMVSIMAADQEARRLAAEQIRRRSR